jgi:hypothetical protein
MGPKVYVSEINSTYQAFGSGTNPATVTKSMGLPADALVVMVFASSSGQLYRDAEILPTYRDFAKTHANPDTDGNSPYHRAVGGNKIPVIILN